MRDYRRDNRINSNNLIAEENVRLTGHPATEKMDLWTVDIQDKTEDVEGNQCKAPETEESRQRKLEEIDEVIKEDIDRL